MEIPLFPLNLVLFPGMPLQLHVFEERYQRMVQDCLKGDRSFGVAMIRKGVEALGPLAEPYRVGCMARIVDIQPLEDGRMNLVVVGKERFRILTLDRHTAPYLKGEIEPFPLRIEDREALRHAAQRLQPRIERYVQLFVQLSNLEKEPEALPDDPDMIGFLAAMMLQIPMEEKQTLLEVESAAELLAMLENVMSRELALMRAMLAESSRSGIGVFSRN
jgi:Lon protease-like protein